jgi:hypothetical protein
MRVNRGLLGWGVFFIVLGAVPLAVREGLLDASVVRRAWELWPLILVGIGLGLILARTKLAVLGGLLVAATFGLMGGALIATGFNPGVGVTTCGFGAGHEGTPFAEQRGSLAGVASVRLEMSCGSVTATGSDGDGWTVSGTSDGGQPPELRRTDRRLVVVAPERRGVGIVGDASKWEVTLPRAGSVAVELSVNAGSGELDLSGMTVPSLDATVNAGEARIDASGARGTTGIAATVNAGSLVLLLPVPGETVSGELSVNAGSASICAPAGVALRFRSDESLGSVNFGDRGLQRDGDTWSTPGYDFAASPHIELTVSANLGSITLDPEDGCD